MNLSLYSVHAFVILDTDGHRVLAKYYNPKGRGYLEGPDPLKGLTTLKDQRVFEKGLFQKTKKPGGDIILYDGHLAVYKHSLDLIFYLLGGPSENELMLHSALSAFSDAVHMLLRNQVEKRAVLENLDLVVLCLDETIDDGIIVETDSTTIASRVSRPKADTSEIVINEQTIMSAYQVVKERVQQRIGQL
ncbi:coatomer protein [Auriscalpium vulgare]|uniref:Coatomer protein n=1 Tax=Auriscalpium vulgare TaxID=40419 RepID=A0ACB8R5J0_9AGAM|nr:coatomer protein [Auriscalpium vulgare]